MTIATRNHTQERSSPVADLQVVADPGTHEIQITRSFDAPRELVYRAFTDPDAVRHLETGHARGKIVVTV